jgi:Mg2+ and Co2+ transporter CorA
MDLKTSELKEEHAAQLIPMIESMRIELEEMQAEVDDRTEEDQDLRNEIGTFKSTISKVGC